MGVLEPVPYMGVCDPYMGVRPWVEVIPLCLFAPLKGRRRFRLDHVPGLGGQTGSNQRIKTERTALAM